MSIDDTLKDVENFLAWQRNKIIIISAGYIRLQATKESQSFLFFVKFYFF